MLHLQASCDLATNLKDRPAKRLLPTDSRDAVVVQPSAAAADEVLVGWRLPSDGGRGLEKFHLVSVGRESSVERNKDECSARTHSGRARVTERALGRCCKASDMDGCVKGNQEANPEKYVFIGEYAGRVAGAHLKPSGTDTELGDKASDGGSMEPSESMQVRSPPEGSTTLRDVVPDDTGRRG